MLAAGVAKFVPCLSSLAGTALTQADWSALGVTSAVYQLADLLVKPGLELLERLPSLAHYVNWPDELVIDAANLSPDAHGICCLRSEFDGSTLCITVEQWLRLVVRLRPQVLILPPAVVAAASRLLPQSIQCLVIANDQLVTSQLQEASCLSGVLIEHEPSNLAHDLASCKAFKQQYPERMIWVSGALSLPAMQQFAALGVRALLSDTPAQAAIHGQVVCAEGVCEVMDQSCAMDFNSLDETCVCPTCLAGFTWAYLHHLYQHTPGLCQRLLMQHNVHFVLQKLLQHGFSATP